MALAGDLRRIVRAVHPGAAISFRTMDDVLASATARQRFQMRVLAAFAAMALTLAVIGIYGVLSYTVSSDRRAIGIRMALGAEPMAVFRSVVAGAMRLTVLGAAVGLAGCFALRSVLQNVVYGVRPTEPAVLAATAGILLLAALLACSIPAWRAMKVDPGRVLREE
jgi:ABC-type antimicrobial peptide transport system permease subunit